MRPFHPGRRVTRLSSADSGPGSRLRVLVLARNYPNPLMPVLGLWTQRMVQCATAFADVKVISPVPW